jgi:hypothetical protein
MVRIECRKSGFTATTGRYTFAFDSGKAAGVLKRAGSDGEGLRISFVPAVDGAAVEGFRVREVRSMGATAAAACESGRGAVQIAFTLNEKSVVYSYTLANPGGLEEFALGEVRGDFFQCHNFDPDLACFDIPRKIETTLRISSRRVGYQEFMQLEEGNFVIPAYVLALSDGRDFFGFGLLDVPQATIPMDCRVGTKRLLVRVDYTGNPPQGEYVSPRFEIAVASNRVGVLEAYRESLGPAEGSRKARPAVWWREPIYTTWGDQVYRKYIEEGRFTSEAGAEKYLSIDLIDEALARLGREGIFPRTIVIDEGWSRALGDWDAEDAKFKGSLGDCIRRKQSQGYRIFLYFSPFLVAKDSEVARTFLEFLVKDPSGAARSVSRSGRDYYLLDWTNAGAREQVLAKVRAMVAPDGLGADGIKIAGTKFLPEPTDVMAERSYGFGEGYLLSVLRDIREAARGANAEAAISLACLNPLFEPYFDIARMGNTSEVNHDLHVLRAETCSWLMPDVPVDTDDWASYQKVIGTTTFIKAVAGIPNIFSAFYRGDGRLKVQGAPGGHPVTPMREQYRTISAAWKMYEFARDAGRGKLRIDYDRMEFSTDPADGGPFVRTYQGGNVLAVYAGKDVYLATLLDAKVVIDIPDGFDVSSVERIGRDGTRSAVLFRKVLKTRILFQALSSRDETWYYHIQGAK